MFATDVNQLIGNATGPSVNPVLVVVQKKTLHWFYCIDFIQGFLYMIEDKSYHVTLDVLVSVCVSLSRTNPLSYYSCFYNCFCVFIYLLQRVNQFTVV